MSLKTLDDLFVHELKDLYSAETQLVKALPKMAKAASSPKLAKGFEKHLAETERQVARLEKAFKILECSPKGEKCAGMEGLLKEGSKMIDEDAEPAVKDAGLISAAQRVEHYEIAGYGVACAFGRLLGQDAIVKLLEQTLAEEKATDAKLSELAETEINIAAEV